MDEPKGQALTRDGLWLAWRGWRPAAPHTALLIVHGLAEHSGRYEHTGRWLARAGYACYALDHRGHGRSPGARVHVDAFDQFLWDVDALEAVVRAQHPGLPVAMLGHSQGGLVVLLQALRHPAGRAAAVVTSPLLGVHPRARPSRARERLLPLLSRVAPRLRLPTALDPATVSRDPAVVDAYARDPLVSRRVSARWFTSVREAMAEAQARAPSLAVPTLVMTAGDDFLVDTEATRRFVARAPAGRIELVGWPGLYHELLNEPEKDEVLARVREWLHVRRA